MQATIDNLKSNANTLNNQFFSGDPSSLASEIESQLREILSYPSIPGHMIDELENTFSMVERSIDSTSHLNFMEKIQIRTLISKARQKIEIRLQNPDHIKISNYTTEKLLSLKYHGYTGDIILTSGMRSVEEQARIMYNNIVNNKGGIKEGIKEQKRIYNYNGDKVINVFDEKLSREENISNMKKMIEKIKESDKEAFKHTGDFSKVNAIDEKRKSCRMFKISWMPPKVQGSFKYLMRTIASILYCPNHNNFSYGRFLRLFRSDDEVHHGLQPCKTHGASHEDGLPCRPAAGQHQRP